MIAYYGERMEGIVAADAPPRAEKSRVEAEHEPGGRAVNKTRIALKVLRSKTVRRIAVRVLKNGKVRKILVRQASRRLISK